MSLAGTPLHTLQLDTYPGTYWQEGALVGAILLGVAGILIADRICGNSNESEHCTEEAFGGAALGVGIGVGLGALIGSRFPKGP